MARIQQGYRIGSLAVSSSSCVRDRYMDHCFMIRFGAGPDTLFHSGIAKATGARETRFKKSQHIQSLEGPIA